MNNALPLTLQDCRRLDRDDPLAPLREQFVLPHDEIYLNGNSLGALPRAAPERLRQVIEHEWGRDLTRSWSQAGWTDLPQRLGDRIAPWVGAGPGEVVVGDSTSVNLYKVLSAAAARVRAAGKGRSRIVSERGNFPTDLYIAHSIARQHGMTLDLLDAPADPAQLDDSVAMLLLSHVDYRSGYLHDLAATTAAAHRAGALMIWDLAHSAGAVPVDLLGADADYAVGCGFKYLNGGPGAPAFVWAHPRHVASDRQPLTGWMGHATPYAFDGDYVAAPDASRYLCGTPALLSMSALACGLDGFDRLRELGGMAALRDKSLALTTLFMQQVDAYAGRYGLRCITPADPARRGSQVSYVVDQGGAGIVQALMARRVIANLRAPDVLRFGFTPLYLGYAQAWQAAEQLRQVLQHGEWRDGAAVTGASGQAGASPPRVPRP